MIKQRRSNEVILQKGFLPEISEYGGKQYLSTTSLIHFKYHDINEIHYLQEVAIAEIPNGLLQDRYNPDQDDTIWLAGRNAPSLGEDFRVRLSFSKLKAKASWRVQKIVYDNIKGECSGRWDL